MFHFQDNHPSKFPAIVTPFSHTPEPHVAGESMVQIQPPIADPGFDPKKRRRMALRLVDTGVVASECVKLFMVCSKEEVGSTECTCLNPIELNSFFGQEGKIYGYIGLKINVWISGISFCSYAEVMYQSTYNGPKGITDLKSALVSIFGQTLVNSKEVFLQSFSKERNFVRDIVSKGEILQPSATKGTDSLTSTSEMPPDLELVRMSTRLLNAGQLYRRLVPLVLLFIDGSNPINFMDPDWQLYILISKKEEEEGVLHQLVGFAAVYRFYRYPDSSRMRLSQILVLPHCQRKGYGRYLVEAVNIAVVKENVYDLTVEEPSGIYQHIRTCIDVDRLLVFDPIRPAIDSAVQIIRRGSFSKKIHTPRIIPPPSVATSVRESLKINKKQLLKCWEILIYLSLDPIEKFIEDFKLMITDHLRFNVLGGGLKARGRQIVSVPNYSEPESSFVVIKSACNDGEHGEMKSRPDQEERLKQLVEERMQEIKLVVEKMNRTKLAHP